MLRVKVRQTVPMVRVLINCKICNTRVFYELNEEEQAMIKEKAIYWPCPVIVKHIDHLLVLHLDDTFRNRGTEYCPAILERDASEICELTKGKCHETSLIPD